MPKIPLDRNQIRRQTAVLMRNKGYSLQEIGDTIGISRERVRQILEKEALTKKPNRNIIKENRKAASVHETDKITITNENTKMDNSLAMNSVPITCKECSADVILTDFDRCPECSAYNR